MKIAIDLRSLSEGRRSGVEEYVLNVVQSLFKIDNINTYFLFKSGFKNQPAVADFFYTGQNKVIEKKLKTANRLLNLSLKLWREPLLDLVSGKPDIFFMPNINIGPVSDRCKKVITFHDLSYEIYPEHFSIKRRLWHKFIDPQKRAREANKIIAISESTKNDLINLYNISSEKIKVIYSGVDDKFQPVLWSDVRLERIKQKYLLPDFFVLYFGAIEPRKNIIGLIKSFEQLKDGHSDKKNLKLVIAGIKGWLFDKIIKTARDSRYASDIIFTGFIANQDKLYVYNLASVFVYPSFYEGFGFPPLEAMACGLPAITSNVSSLPEVVGDGAIMVDPYNADEITQAMDLCLSNEDLRSELREKGLTQAKKFSWQKTAKETLDWITK